MAQQQDFLRFTDWKNEFEPEEFKQFLAEFDIDNPEFLAWIEQNTAPYAYFEFYSLLVKNYHCQQQHISKILDFLLKQTSSIDAFISFIKEPQKKYPDILDLDQFEQCLIQHLQSQDIKTYFPEFKSLFSACCLFSFRFQKIPHYLCQHVIATNSALVYELTMCCHWHNHDYGILDKLLEFTQQGHRYNNIYHDLKNWAERSEDLIVREKIATIMQLTLNDLLKDPTPYYSEIYLNALQNHQAKTIEGYIDFCRYLSNTKTKEFLNQLIENQNLHIAIRFESVLVYFLTFQQQHPLKGQLTQQLLTLPLGQRWGSSSANHGFVYNSDLFKQPDFFNLDEILLALHSTQWCYEACKALHHYSDDIEIQQNIIMTVIDTVAAMIQRMLKVKADDYVNAAPIDYLVSLLKKYNLNTEQRQKLESTLIDGLEWFFAHFAEQKHLHKEMIEIIFSFEFKLPDEYLELLNSWTKLELTHQEKNLTKQQIWQQLIDAEVISQDAEFDPESPIFPNFLGHANMLMYSSRNNDNSFYGEVFESYFPHKIKWLYDEEQIKNIPTDQLIFLNRENTELEWKNIERSYFKYDEKYYTFFIYDFMGRDWVNFPSFISVFHQILKYFNINKAVYQLKDTEGFGRDDVFFSAHPEKFEQVNQILGIECIEPIFFIPEAKSAQFLFIESEFNKIVKAGGFVKAGGLILSLNRKLVEIPKPQSLVSKDAQKWLISMIDEMRSRALSSLRHKDFSQQAIDIRNLFISLALNMIADFCVANQLKKKHPLWESSRYQAENLDQQQRRRLLDFIFEETDLANCLQYPYS